MDSILVYDGDCRVCRLAKDLLKVLDWRRRIRSVPLQDPESARLLAAVPEERRWTSFHLLRNGRAASRGEGVIQILGVLPFGGGIPRLAAETPLLRTMSERLYAVFHGVRDALRCAT
ncbi:MAG: DCC1-like thiol-disulfide oxidoreductase family protein [Candidatus Thermoplasmatota archaeon]